MHLVEGDEWIEKDSSSFHAFMRSFGVRSFIRWPLWRPWLPSPMLRETMNIKVSDDGGRTWQQHVQLWGADAGNCVPPCVPA